MIDLITNNEIDIEELNRYKTINIREKEIIDLNKRIDGLEKEIQSLKDNFKNIYEVFFREDLTNK